MAIVLLSGEAMAQAADPDRIDALERIIESQQRQIEAQSEMLRSLQQQMQELRAPVPEPRETAQPAPESAEPAPLPANIVTSGKDDIELTISGQVNRALLFADDGEETELFHVDNDNSSTRIRAVGIGQVTDDLQVGAQIEVQFESNSSADVNQLEEQGVGPNNFTERKLEVFAKSERFGNLWLGQGDTASNGSSEVDLSGTEVIAYSGVDFMAGGLLFRDSDTGDLTATTIGDVFDNLDGLSRDDRLRYDTPEFAGLQVSASAIAGNQWDVALSYARDFAAFKAAAAIAYAELNAPGFDYRLSGSASLLHQSGFNATFAAGMDDPDTDGRDEPTFWYAKLGYLADLFAFGPTAFAIDFMESEAIVQNGDEGMAYGAFVVQNVEDYGIDLYLGVRNHELDRPGQSLEDILAAMAGARVKF